MSDTYLALIAKLGSRLTGDATLASLMGGTVNLHHGLASKDAPMPYIVHLARFGVSRRIVCKGRWLIDLWDCLDLSGSADGERIVNMRDRIITLMDWIHLNSAEAVGIHIELDESEQGFVATDSEKVLRYELPFSLAFARGREVDQILENALTR
ncbi:MAG: hypothetical protein KAY24_18290 [Candidatus Eisenbacteria sp.]|nr:hypothetical protein [Candidatus Eisenbacteria bacterium]